MLGGPPIDGHPTPSDPDPSPPLELPFSFRVGSLGAGLGVGCGLGLGFGRPLNLGEPTRPTSDLTWISPGSLTTH